MNGWILTLTIIAVISVIILIILFVLGKKLQDKQNNAEAQMKASGQTVSMLVIDKKKMKMKDANLPKIVMDQTPKYLKATKVPLVKAKIGPQITTLVCDPKVFELIPVKKEVKAVVSGIYITDVKGLRSNLETENPKMKKKRLKAEKRKKQLNELSKKSK